MMNETTGIIILLICHILQFAITNRLLFLSMKDADKLKAKESQANDNVLRLNTSHDVLKLRVSQLNTENAGLKQACKNSSESISKYKKEVTGLEQQIRHLEAQLSKAVSQ